MFIKTLIAAAAVVSTVAVTAPAQAGKWDVDVNIGLGGFDGGYGGGYGDGYGDGYGGGYGDDYYGEGYGHGGYHSSRIECWEGKQKVRWAGFRQVRPLDCEGRSYSYKAYKRGNAFIVKVSSRSGNIISVRNLY